MNRILVPLAEDFEEIEAIVPIDVWRRAGYEVIVAGLQPSPLRATRKTRHVADVLLDEVLGDEYELIFLPGGLPGADHLAAHDALGERLKKQAADGKWIAAICAAPKVLDKQGLLAGRSFTCHPGTREALQSPATDARVVVDGKLITGIAAGAAMELALTVVREISGEEKVREVNAGLLCSSALLPLD